VRYFTLQESGFVEATLTWSASSVAGKDFQPPMMNMGITRILREGPPIHAQGNTAPVTLSTSFLDKGMYSIWVGSGTCGCALSFELTLVGPPVELF
jgi:hypothetical protein